MTSIPLERLNAAGDREFLDLLGGVFENAPWVAEAVRESRPFPTLVALFEAMTAAVRTAGAERQLNLIRGHPDLAGKAARAGAMTEHSTAEQTSAGLDRLSPEEFDKFHRLNAAHGEKFGFPFIICVRRHTKDSILREFECRLRNDAAREHETALAEIFRIAALRLDARIAADDRLEVHGRLSTHVLDTQAGRPAPGVAIELLELAQTGDPRLVARATTNVDGRTDAPLIAGRPLPIGRYELRFAVGDYFARSGAQLADPSFLDVVPVRFAVAEPEAHYHVPLLVTPWSYATYRGS